MTSSMWLLKKSQQTFFKPAQTSADASAYTADGQKVMIFTTIQFHPGQ